MFRMIADCDHCKRDFVVAKDAKIYERGHTDTQVTHCPRCGRSAEIRTNFIEPVVAGLGLLPAGFFLGRLAVHLAHFAFPASFPLTHGAIEDWGLGGMTLGFAVSMPAAFFFSDHTVVLPWKRRAE
jgi:hypothetical protein